MIIHSTYTRDTPEIDGRFWVHETHTDNINVQHTQNWLASASDDLAAALALHAAAINQSLADNEIGSNLSAIMSAGAAAQPVNIYSTLAQNVAAVRVAFPSMDIGQMSMTADYLMAHSDAVLEGVFGMDADQVAALRALPSPDEQLAAFAAVAA